MTDFGNDLLEGHADMGQRVRAAGRAARRRPDVMLLARNLSSLCQGVLLDWSWLGDDFEETIGRLRSGLALQVIPLQTTNARHAGVNRRPGAMAHGCDGGDGRRR